MPAPEGYLSMKDCAAEMGVRYNTVKGWFTKHGCPHQKVGGRYYGRVDEIRAWMKSVNRTTARGRRVGELQLAGGQAVDSSGDVREDLLEAKLRKEIAQAQKVELQVAKEKGLLVAQADVEQANLDKIARAKAILMGGPSTLAVDLVGLEVEEIERHLKDWVHAALEELARD